jgi:hypothetical protein
MMVRVDDRQIGLEDFFPRLGQPILADAGHAG